MKYTIEGFSQEEATKLQKTVIESGKTKTIRLDCIDLVLLRWFVDFFPSMMKVTIDGIQYAWVSYQAILDDMPLLGLGKRSLFDRLRKMSQLGVLMHKTVRRGGTFSYYGFGGNYSLLIRKHDSDHVQNISNPMKQTSEGYEADFRGGMKQTSDQINPSTIDDPSTKSIHIEGGAKRKRFVPPTIDEVRAYCEERHDSVDPQRFLDYYSMTGWKTKGGATIKDWKACVRTWERNARSDSRSTQEVGANGIKLRPLEKDEDTSWFPIISTSNVKEE